MDNPITLAAVAIVVILVLVTGSALFAVQRSLKRLHASFAKLGFANREDAKKYFEDASQKVADMNQSYYQDHQRMIEQGVRKVISESSVVIEETLLKAQKDAGDIIIRAQQEAEQIRMSTRLEAHRYYDQAVEDAVDTLEWTLEQYLTQHMDIRQHEDVIQKLLDAYINERKN